MQSKPGFKVLQIVNRMNLGGITMQICLVSKGLSNENEVRVLAGLKDETEASSNFIAENMGIEVETIHNMHKEINPIADFKAYREIVKIIREFKPDIVHTHAAKAGALGRLAALNEGVPVIVHTFHGHVFHSYFSPLKTKVFLFIERYLSKKSSKTIAISKKQFEELCYDYKIDEPSKFEIIPLGFDLEKFRENKEEKRAAFRKTYHIKENEIAIGIIGRLVPVKNHSFFLEAFKEAKNKTNRKIKAVIIGDGELKDEVFAKAAELNLNINHLDADQTDIIFTSWITEIENALPGLDIMALTSLNEGTPVSLIEAQAAGVAIVSTNVGGVEDIVIENETALLSSKTNVSEFANHLLKLVEDDIMRKSFAENGYKNVIEKFGFERLVSDVKRLYIELLAGVN